MVGRKVSLEIDRPEPEHVDTILKVVDLSVDKPDGSKGWMIFPLRSKKVRSSVWQVWQAVARKSFARRLQV